MAEFKESEHPRDSGGKFAEKQGAEQTRKWTADPKPQRQRKQTAISKREYAIVDSARKQKFAEYRRSGVPKQDYVFTDNKFVLFTNNTRDEYKINIALDIEQEQDKIAHHVALLEKERKRK